MAARHRPLFTENFAANLDSIRLFLEPEGRSAFRRLLGRLFDDIVPTLCRFPQSGRPFLAHAVRSLEAQALLDRLKTVLHKGPSSPWQVGSFGMISDFWKHAGEHLETQVLLIA